MLNSKTSAVAKEGDRYPNMMIYPVSSGGTRHCWRSWSSFSPQTAKAKWDEPCLSSVTCWIPESSCYLGLTTVPLSSAGVSLQAWAAAHPSCNTTLDLTNGCLWNHPRYQAQDLPAPGATARVSGCQSLHRPEQASPCQSQSTHILEVFYLYILFL